MSGLHEPQLALHGGEDGLSIVRRVIDGACAHLKAGGILLFEFSPEQARAVHQHVSTSGNFQNVRIVSDLSRQPRVVIGRGLSAFPVREIQVPRPLRPGRELRRFVRCLGVLHPLGGVAE